VDIVHSPVLQNKGGIDFIKIAGLPAKKKRRGVQSI
jgi:hypothetical protein